jgi:hypothetical protein
MSKILKIDDNWSIETDQNNCTLIFREKRIATKGKNAGEEFEFTDEFYYPSVYTALKRYLLEKQKDADDVQDCIRITEDTFEKLKTLKFESQ